MIITFLAEDLILDGSYYTPPFLVEKSNLTVQVSTGIRSIASIESSIDGEDYFEISDTSFTIIPIGGIQSYTDAQRNLIYRIKIDNLPTKIKILV